MCVHTQVTGFSPQGSIRVCQRLLGSLVRLTSAAQNSESRQLGLRAVLCLVTATREAVIEMMPGQRAGVQSAHASPRGLHENGHAGVSASSQLGSTESNRLNSESLLAGKGTVVLELALRTAAAQWQAQHVAADSEGDPIAVGSAKGGSTGTDKEAESRPQTQDANHKEIPMLQLQVHSLFPLIGRMMLYQPLLPAIKEMVRCPHGGMCSWILYIP